jgi:hypothetical protein
MKTYYKILGILIIALGLKACNDFVEIEPPKSQLTGAVVFEEPSTANAALIDIYTKLRDKGILTGTSVGASVNLGLYADELIYYGMLNETLSQLFDNALMDNNGLVQQYWNESYHQIYCANAVIEGCENSTQLIQTYKAQFIGEALFIRAMVHFYLLNIYGDVPYITTTNYEQNRLAVRLSKTNVYEHIIEDLKNAIELLPENYLTQDRVRPNKAVATALLARVYLYNENWLEAEMTSSSVINDGAYVLEALDNVFLKQSAETIWQFSPENEGFNAYEGNVFIFSSGPPPFVGLRNEVVSEFSSEDLRKSVWIKTIDDGENTWYHAYKYKQNSNTATSIEYSIVLRLAEQYLIRAESRAKQGNLAGAIDDINKIRNRAGLTNTSAITTQQIIDEIIVQRRLELFTEFGHRFLDLKRTSKSDNVLPLTKAGWDSHDNLWPIPLNEILSNPNMTQNSGY